MRIELWKSTFGYRQNCTLDVVNKSDGVHIRVIKAEHPSLVGEDVVFYLINEHRGTYDCSVTSMKEAKQAANNGFLAYQVEILTEQLNRAKFAQKIAKRNNVFVHDKTVNQGDSK